MKDLLPCPFCGSDNLIEANQHMPRVSCRACGASGPPNYTGTLSAIRMFSREQWNDRRPKQEVSGRNGVGFGENLRSTASSVTAFALAWLLLCSVSLGQIKLVESKTETWAGLKNAVLNDDGTITTGPDSKPILTAKSVRFSFETAVAYKFKQLKAKRLSTGEKVSMEQEKDKETYWFRAGAPEGKYELEYTVFDPEKGIDSDEWVIDYKPIVAPVPGPVDPVKPDDVVPTDEVELAVSRAILDVRKGWGAAFIQAAKAIDSKQITVDAQLQSYLEPLTRAARQKAMSHVDELLQAKIPRNVDKLKPEAAKFVESIGLAFEKGTK